MTAPASPTVGARYRCGTTIWTLDAIHSRDGKRAYLLIQPGVAVLLTEAVFAVTAIPITGDPT